MPPPPPVPCVLHWRFLKTIPCWIQFLLHLVVSFRIKSYQKNGKLTVVAVHVHSIAWLIQFGSFGLGLLLAFNNFSWIFFYFLEGMCYPRYFSSLFFPSPCSVFTRSGSYVPGNFLIFYDRLIRYDHTCSYFVIWIQVKDFWVLLNITLKCPRFVLIFIHCYTLERGTFKS